MVPGVSAEAFNDALRREYEALRAGVVALRERADRLQNLADSAREYAERDQRQLKALGDLLGIESQTSLDSLSEPLRGRRLREIAEQVLREVELVGEPVHYRRWYALLREAGYRIGGCDPVATFLATISKAPGVESVGGRSGLYILRKDA